MSMYARKPADETWYVHAPLKREVNKPIQNVPPASQIPYLNGVLDTEDDLKQKDLWFKETDTDFIKLSKLGGRDDLLIHRHKEPSREPVGYPRAAWWTDMLTEYEKSEKDEIQAEPYQFEVPAWFAHNHKISQDEHEVIYKPHESSSTYVPSFHKYEPIEEPRKYGQLRNYLNPTSVKLPKSKTSLIKNVVNNNYVRKLEENHNRTDVNMHKLLANMYHNDKPKDYKEWKETNKK